MKFRKRTLERLGDLICGNLGAADPQVGAEPAYFPYRSSSYITEFFAELDMEWEHDGSTRHRWVAGVLEQLLGRAARGVFTPTGVLLQGDRPLDESGGCPQRGSRPARCPALAERSPGKVSKPSMGRTSTATCGTNTASMLAENPHRPLSVAEMQRRAALAAFLETCSEDALIEEILLPLFRQLGFHRITAAGHRDKALEYGKDIWMRYTLPSQHFLYFGIQVKRGKLDATGKSRAGNANIAEIHNQALMTLAHEIFDPETSRRVLVDHAFTVAGGEITKAARNWLGNALDAAKRSQIMFMDRDDILNQFVVTNLPLQHGLQTLTAAAVPEGEPADLLLGEGGLRTRGRTAAEAPYQPPRPVRGTAHRPDPPRPRRQIFGAKAPLRRQSVEGDRGWLVVCERDRV
ncbi:hypothetical protein [Streptomyces sp. D2-8]|uniref:hypothetical protein n=1 Tax=Streptomyces sp. D2-8 TaxID=2707767 RepID=UPI0020BD5D8F|nr:hypothetical protein [Streptomyces sp. D2-8]